MKEMPKILRNHACKEYIDTNGNGKILINGGMTTSYGQIKNVWDYDIATNDYVARNPLPAYVRHHKLTKDNDKMWILFTHDRDLPIYYIDLSSEDTWKSMPLSNSKKHFSRDSWAFPYNLKNQ